MNATLRNRLSTWTLGALSWMSIGCGEDSRPGDDTGAPAVGTPAPAETSSREELEGCYPMNGNEVGILLGEMQDDLETFCETESTLEAALTWRAPHAGRFVLTSSGGVSIEGRPLYSDTSAGTLYEWNSPPRLAVKRASCDEEATIECSDRTSAGDYAFGRLVVPLEEGEEITIYAEVSDRKARGIQNNKGNSGAPYGASIIIKEVACGASLLPEESSVSQDVRFSPTASPVGPASCGKHSLSERAAAETSLKFIAPEAGSYLAQVEPDVGGHEHHFARFNGECSQERECVFTESSSVRDRTPLKISFDASAGEEVVFVVGVTSSEDQDPSSTISVALQDTSGMGGAGGM